jgi:acyl-CoA thioester hydrolase
MAHTMEVTNPPAELALFPAVVQLPVEWGDQDAFGHVNNAVYFRWFETSRIAYLERIGLGDKHEGKLVSGENIGPILAAISCNYRKQIKYPDTVIIGARITRIGRSSMTMSHSVWSQKHQGIAADGESTVVVFDYTTNQPRRIPDDLRELIEKLEGRPLSGIPR